MRRTVIERLEARRLEAYDPDYHGMLDCDGGLRVNITHIGPGEMKMRFNFEHFVKKRDSGEKFGLIEGSAVTEIRDAAISSDGIKPKMLNLPENIEKLIEGAYAQDVLLPVSHLATAMRLPMPLISPIDFSVMFSAKPTQKQTHLPETSAEA